MDDDYDDNISTSFVLLQPPLLRLRTPGDCLNSNAIKTRVTTRLILVKSKLS